MWKVGMNKSQANHSSRQASEDDGNKSHRSYKRFISKNEEELKPEILRRSQSKSSIKKSSRVMSDKQSNDNSGSIIYSRKDSQFNPCDSIIKTETKVSQQTQNDFNFILESRISSRKLDIGQYEIFNSPKPNPLKKKDSFAKSLSTKISIGIQVEQSNLVQNSMHSIHSLDQTPQTIISKQKHQIKALCQKIQLLQRTNDLYQFKIAQLQIDFTSFRSYLTKQLSKQKQQMLSTIKTLKQILNPVHSNNLQLQQIISKRTVSEVQKQSISLSPEEYIANILNSISVLKSRFKTNPIVSDDNNINKFKTSLHKLSQQTNNIQNFKRNKNHQTDTLK